MQIRESKPKVRFVILMSTIIFFGICWTLLGLLILKNQDDIKIMQTDTLDQLMEVRQQELPWVDRDVTQEEWEEIVKPKPESLIEDPEPVQPTVTYQLSSEERTLIERIVMSESGIEGLQAQMAVAQTIYDRMHDFGDSLTVAVETYSQRDNGDPTGSVKLAVSNVFDKGERIYDGGTYQFHDDTVSPYWTKGKVCRGSIGKLRFYGGYETADGDSK